VSYQLNVEGHIVPALGRVPLQRLTPPQLTAFYRTLLDGGRRNDRGGLAPKTVRNIHGALHTALKDAVRWGYVARNVATAADLPKGMTPEMHVWNPEQLRTFLEHVQEDRLYAAWLLLATTATQGGCGSSLGGHRPRRRPGLAAATSCGRQVRGRRVGAENGQGPPLARPRPSHDRGPTSAPHEAACGTACGWLALAGLRSVFTWPDGRPLHPERFSKWFEQHTRAAGLPKIRLHDVRHSYATAALAAGVPAKVVSERLGHATIAITMDPYSHVLPGLDAEAAGTVARLILGESRREQPAAVKPLSSGRKAMRRRKEVKGERPGQDWGDRGDSNPRPSGPQPDALTN
jgi:hypothetical protein